MNTVSRPTFTRPTPAPAPQKAAFDDKDRGVLFENDKGDNDKRPDYTGKISFVVPEGAKAGDVIERRLAAWQRDSNGKPYLSLAVSKPLSE